MDYNLLKVLMDGVNGASFISIDTVTSVTLPGGKANLLQGRVTKKTTGSSVMVFQNKTTNGYENMVNRRLEEEGHSVASFTVGPRQWGQRIENTPFVEHNGQVYLEVIFLHPGETTYLLDGQPSTNPNVIPPTKSTDNWGQDGLVNKVIIRTFKVENITGITINKQRVEMK